MCACPHFSRIIMFYSQTNIVLLSFISGLNSIPLSSAPAHEIKDELYCRVIYSTAKIQHHHLTDCFALFDRWVIDCRSQAEWLLNEWWFVQINQIIQIVQCDLLSVIPWPERFIQKANPFFLAKSENELNRQGFKGSRSRAHEAIRGYP